MMQLKLIPEVSNGYSDPSFTVDNYGKTESFVCSAVAGYRVTHFEAKVGSEELNHATIANGVVQELSSHTFKVSVGIQKVEIEAFEGIYIDVTNVMRGEGFILLQQALEAEALNEYQLELEERALAVQEQDLP
jgi:hypothetical protein